MTERRQWPRYSLDLPLRVEGIDQSGTAFVLEGNLRNISARGALGRLTSGLQPGTHVRIEIALPFSQQTWICYEGEVLRTEAAAGGVDTALRFISVRPSFRGDEFHG